jgi:uncharacterized protein YyaL (SSP411 family)
MTEHKHTNRLSKEKSPYLLQHAHNPVDWYPWGEEAFEKANKENKPVFLSIGYSTCHWCHVMERESFEDLEVAQMLNLNFVPIKVDREERPDIDHIYMSFCQMLTGHGGWPLTVILTPKQKPFFAGTYFPKRGKRGMQGLMELLEKVKDTWKTNREALLIAGEGFIQSMNEEEEIQKKEGNISKDVLDTAFEYYTRMFEHHYGGFSKEPKFPSPHNLSFLLRYWKATGEEKALQMVEKTLDGMYRGGIFDHIGFGFSRYSVDRKWLVPHFEKMLYDNALLAIAYIEAYQVTHNNEYADAANKIFKYVLRDMTSPEGGFYAAEDADSEGEEGKFYCWDPKEIIKVLGEADGKYFCEYYGITEKGNFEGLNIPNRIETTEPVSQNEEQIEPLRQKVFMHREQRVHPFKDDKIITSWNGLMIAAMAMGGRVLQNESYIQAAEKALSFILRKLVREDGRLLARYRDGEAAFPAYVDDYAFITWGLIELYQSTYKPEYLLKALKINDEMLIHFWDKENGGLFLYGKDSEQLISRPKEVYDGAIPSGNSVAAMNFLRLARLTGDRELEAMSDAQLKAFASYVEKSPVSYSHFLSALLFSLYPSKEVVISGNRQSNDTLEMLRVLHSGFSPQVVSLLNTGNEDMELLFEAVPFIREQKALGGKATAYVCQNYACQAPLTDAGTLQDVLYNQ